MKQVWQMTKAQLVAEMDERLAAEGMYRAWSANDPLRWSKTELENEVARLREQAAR